MVCPGNMWMATLHKGDNDDHDDDNDDDNDNNNNNNNRDDWNYFKLTQTIPEQHSGKARD